MFWKKLLDLMLDINDSGDEKRVYAFFAFAAIMVYIFAMRDPSPTILYILVGLFAFLVGASIIGDKVAGGVAALAKMTPPETEVVEQPEAPK